MSETLSRVTVEIGDIYIFMFRCICRLFCTLTPDFSVSLVVDSIPYSTKLIPWFIDPYPISQGNLIIYPFELGCL